MDDSVYDGTSLPSTMTETGGDGPAYEAVAGEPAPDTVTAGPETVAASLDTPVELVESDDAGTTESDAPPITP
jgi:hypothetical protein